MNVLLAFSGGLDTSFCAVWLQEQGHIVHTVTVDTGGFSPKELDRIESVSMQCGCASHTTVDGRAYLFDRFLRYLIYGNVLRGQLYPLSVSAERVAQAKLIADAAAHLGVEAIAHGSTGAGNDQVRFDTAFRILAPRLEVMTPIRQLGLSRQAETDYLAEHGVAIPPKTNTYSVNEGMWGMSIGGRETLSSEKPVPDEEFPTGVIPTDLAPRTVEIGFERGIPTSIDGFMYAPVDLVHKLNQMGGQFGIGRGHHLGDTILGIKGRIGFEAPAAHLLIGAHRELEKLVLSGKQLFWKESLGNLYGSLLHEGEIFDPICRDLEQFLESSQGVVTGTATLQMHPHAFRVQGVTSPHSLMKRDFATYGEENRLWNGDEAAGFTKVFSVGQLVANSNREAFE